MKPQTVTIPARHGKAARVEKGQIIKVINTHGQQVVDTWAFSGENNEEFMSIEHSRGQFLKLRPEIGDTFITQKRLPILTLIEDTSPGVHDTVLAACDEKRYYLMGCSVYHRNCADNLSEGLTDLGIKETRTPSPLNLFMNIPWDNKGALTLEAPVSKPGDYVVFRAEMNAVIAFSACPQDILPINGLSQDPKEAHFEILSDECE